MARVKEADVVIIGSGITAAMAAEHLAEHTGASILVVEAGDEAAPPEQRPALRQRFLDYGESPWPHDHVDGLEVDGIQSRSMQVGGLAMHWGAVTPRFSPEDFRQRSLYGVGTDWPITYEELDPFYQEAEERLGVAGEQGPAELDPRGKPYPMPAIPLTYNLAELKTWTDGMGIPMWAMPAAKNSTPYGGRAECCRNDTCYPICPIGAKYSPDFTWRALRGSGRVELLPRTVVRRLELTEGDDRVASAVAYQRDRPDEPLELRAKVFALGGGYVWTSHLLLLSASSRYPDGLANRSGNVGRWLAGHRNVYAYVELPKRLYPGMNGQHSLVTKKYMRPGKPGGRGAPERYVRHDLRVWESDVGRRPRLRDDAGNLLLGDAALADWRGRTRAATARVRAYYDVVPGRDSRLTLDARRRTPWGDPLPVLSFADAPESAALRGWTEEHLKALFAEMARAGGGKVLFDGADDFQDHPSGGCRMGDDPATSVCDAWGRTHDHPNLYVLGAPTCVSSGCANGTLTFSALALRSAHRMAGELGAGSAA